MKSLLPAILLPFLVLNSSGQTPAPAAGLTDDETVKVLEEITKVQREFAKLKKEVVASALERFKAAAADDAGAMDFFLASYRVVNLDRKPARTKEEAEARADGEWQKTALASLGDGASPTVMRMQLQLLVLMLESATAKDAGETVAALRTYLHDVIAFLPTAAAALEAPPAHRPVATAGKKGARKNDEQAEEKERLRKKTGATKLLRQSVMSTLFAEAYNLGSYIEAPALWPQSPVDFQSAYTNVILPWYRANKKTALPEVWDEFLKGESTIQQISLTPAALMGWGAKEYKQLYWSKWLDLLASGVNATAATLELVKTIRENPNHAAMKTWITDLAKVAETMGGLKFDATTTPDTKPPDRTQ